MRATVMFGVGHVRIETVPDARLIEPTDALVVVTRAAICGSDLWPYKTMEHSETGRRMGHEAIGVVMPFAYSDGTCVFCHEGRIWAGGVDKDVTFVDADADLHDQIDAAYRTKYRRYAASIIRSIVSPEARSATIKLVPRSTSS